MAKQRSKQDYLGWYYSASQRLHYFFADNGQVYRGSLTNEPVDKEHPERQPFPKMHEIAVVRSGLPSDLAYADVWVRCQWIDLPGEVTA